MEKVTCKSCGGALQKISETAYKCMFCGTVHQLGLDDSESVRELLEQNNERWLYINKKMEAFFASVNRASALEGVRRDGDAEQLALRIYDDVSARTSLPQVAA